MVYTGNPSGRTTVGRRWRQLQAQVYAEESTCWLCGQAVNMALRDLDPTNRWAPSVDHVIPKSLRPDLALVRANLRLAHFGCNSSRGTGMRRPRAQRW